MYGNEWWRKPEEEVNVLKVLECEESFLTNAGDGQL